MGEGSGAHAMQNSCPLLGKEVSFLYACVYQALAVGLQGVYFLGQDRQARHMSSLIKKGGCGH